MRHNTGSKSSGNAATRLSGQNLGSGHRTQARVLAGEPVVPSPQQKLHADSLQVLGLLKILGITFGAFVYAIFYGNPESRADLTMRAARKSFLGSGLFSEFLQNLWKPPRAPSGGGKSTTTGRDVLLAFASSTMQSIFEEELHLFSKTYAVAKEDLVDPEELAKVNTVALDLNMQSSCKHPYKTLLALTGDDEMPEEEDVEEEVEEALDGYKCAIKPHPHFVSRLVI